MRKVLVTGGAGYIGSTIGYALEDSGFVPIIVDDLSTGIQSRIARMNFYRGDIADAHLMNSIFREHPTIIGVIHCAAKIIVPESMKNPAFYYEENVGKSIELFRNLKDIGIQNIIFSSSASVYRPTLSAVDEFSPTDPNNVYARSKLMTEQILSDFCEAYKLKGVSFRYFNPVGADPKMRTGQNQTSGTHVIAKMFQSVMTNSIFEVTGTSWSTRDGSGLRDYIHVWDIALAHVEAMKVLHQKKINMNNPHEVINLGSGVGTTVFELLKAFEMVTGHKILHKNADPRPGDVGGAFASFQKASRLLGWRPTYTLEQAIQSAVDWTTINSGRQ